MVDMPTIVVSIVSMLFDCSFLLTVESAHYECRIDTARHEVVST